MGENPSSDSIPARISRMLVSSSMTRIFLDMDLLAVSIQKLV